MEPLLPSISIDDSDPRDSFSELNDGCFKQAHFRNSRLKVRNFPFRGFPDVQPSIYSIAISCYSPRQCERKIARMLETILAFAEHMVGLQKS